MDKKLIEEGNKILSKINDIKSKKISEKQRLNEIEDKDLDYKLIMEVSKKDKQKSKTHTINFYSPNTKKYIVDIDEDLIKDILYKQISRDEKEQKYHEHHLEML